MENLQQYGAGPHTSNIVVRFLDDVSEELVVSILYPVLYEVGF
jgi:hypothetical protein